MKVVFKDHTGKETIVAENCTVDSTWKVAMTWLRENDKTMSPSVRLWANETGDMATMDYGSHTEFIYFYGTVNDIKKLIGGTKS